MCCISSQRVYRAQNALVFDCEWLPRGGFGSRRLRIRRPGGGSERTELVWGKGCNVGRYLLICTFVCTSQPRTNAGASCVAQMLHDAPINEPKTRISTTRHVARTRLDVDFSHEEETILLIIVTCRARGHNRVPYGLGGSREGGRVWGYVD